MYICLLMLHKLITTELDATSEYDNLDQNSNDEIIDKDNQGILHTIWTVIQGTIDVEQYQDYLGSTKISKKDSTAVPKEEEFGVVIYENK